MGRSMIGSPNWNGKGDQVDSFRPDSTRHRRQTDLRCHAITGPASSYGDADAKILTGAASMYLRMGDLTRSEETFQKLTQVAPTSSEPWYNLASCRPIAVKTSRPWRRLRKPWSSIRRRSEKPASVNLREHLYQDPGFAHLRQTPEFKAAFPAKLEIS